MTTGANVSTTTFRTAVVRTPGGPDSIEIIDVPVVEPGPGHIMKLRYTSLQADTGTGEEHHPDVPATLDFSPVVV